MPGIDIGRTIRRAHPERAAVSETPPEFDMQGLAHCQPTNDYETYMTNGIVKFFNTQKGFGFIAPTNGGNDVFVHISALERAGIAHLNEGQKVSYETEIDKRSGKSAVSTIELV